MNSATYSEINTIEHPFLLEFIRQFRLQDREGIYQNWSNEELLQSLIFSVNHGQSSLGELGILAFYNAITAEVEKETGKLMQTFINFTHKGLGSVVICCGCLLVMTESVQKNFNFDSLETLILKAEALIVYAMRKIGKFF